MAIIRFGLISQGFWLSKNVSLILPIIEGGDD